MPSALERFACRLVGHQPREVVCSDCGEMNEAVFLELVHRIPDVVVKITASIDGFGVSMRNAMAAMERWTRAFNPRTQEEAMEEAGLKVDAWQDRQNRVYEPRRLLTGVHDQGEAP